IVMFLILLAVGTGVMLLGCSSNPPPTTYEAAAPTTQPLLGFIPPPPTKTGAQLWAENCSRCHNMRPPESYSDPQWAMIVHHMRSRADLTGDEAKKITQFLQASN